MHALNYVFQRTRESSIISKEARRGLSTGERSRKNGVLATMAICNPLLICLTRESNLSESLAISTRITSSAMLLLRIEVMISR